MAVAAASTLIGVEALAADCTTLPNPIYAIGGSSPQPILAKVGTQLSNLAQPVTFIYNSAGGSCSGVNAIVNSTNITGNGIYWDNTGKQQSCTFALPQAPDFAIATTFATSCPGVSALPAGIGQFAGPIQSFEFIVPNSSSQTAISAEAGYFLFNFPGGTKYPVSPWTLPANVITRNNQSGAAIIMALTLNVPLANLADVTVFTDGKTSGGSLTDVANFNLTAQADATIGIVSTDVAQGAAPSTINVLAYQHYGQQCGWTPSSTPTGTDLINVRNGHYVPWANVQFLAAVDNTNTPTNTNAKNFIGWFTGTVAPPAGVDTDLATIQAGGVIDCAMEVKRTGDLTALIPYAPAAPCGCYFDKTATGTTSCQACTSSASCPVNAPNCTKGYCEVN